MIFTSTTVSITINIILITINVINYILVSIIIFNNIINIIIIIYSNPIFIIIVIEFVIISSVLLKNLRKLVKFAGTDFLNVKTVLNRSQFYSITESNC